MPFTESTIFLRTRQLGRAVFPTIFKPGTQLRIKGYESVHVNEIMAFLQANNIAHGLTNRSIAFPSAPSTPTSTLNTHTVHRGYPLYNFFNARRSTDGGFMTVPDSIIEATEANGEFSMEEIAKISPLAACQHLLGNTAWRSYTESAAVAVAFAMTKSPEDGALAIEHWNKIGTQLIAQMYSPASTQNFSLAQGLMYQKELAGPMLPLARQECTTIFYKQDGAMNLTNGFNIMSPFNLNLNQFLLANGDEHVVKMVHKYDQTAFQAAMAFSKAMGELHKAQLDKLGPEQLVPLQERANQAYKNMLAVEIQFRKEFTTKMKEQVEKGNPLAADLQIPAEVPLDQALLWYMSAICYSKGAFVTSSGQDCNLNIRDDGSFVLEWQEGGSTVSKSFTEQEAQAVLPYLMLPTFDLISGDGQFDYSDGLPKPVEQVIATSFVSMLRNKKDPDAAKLIYQAPTPELVSQLSIEVVSNEQDQTLNAGVSA